MSTRAVVERERERDEGVERAERESMRRGESRYEDDDSNNEDDDTT